MKLFVLNRKEDESGIYGTGYVAEGVVFSNGKCALSWLGLTHASVAIYDSLEALIAIHGHDGKTVIEWIENWDDFKAKISWDRELRRRHEW